MRALVADDLGEERFVVDVQPERGNLVRVVHRNDDAIGHHNVRGRFAARGFEVLGV